MIIVLKFHWVVMLHVLGLKLMICNVCTAEWDLGGFPPWLLTIEPALKLRSSDSSYLSLVFLSKHDQSFGM